MYYKQPLAENSDRMAVENPIRYTSNLLQKGNIAEKKLKLIRNSVSMKVSRVGKGKVQLFTDHINIRTFWCCANKLLITAIFIGDLMLLK